MKEEDTLDYELMVRQYVENVSVITDEKNIEFINNEEPKDFLFISGGATRFIGLGAAAIRLLEKGYRPSVYGGISAGAILVMPLIMGKYAEIIDFGLKATPKNIFKVPPVDEKGKITWCGIWRVLRSNYSFGLQDVKPMVRAVITPEVFKEYQEGDYPDAYIMAVNGNTAARKVWNIKDKSIDYEKYLKIVSASSRIPIMTQAQWIDGEPYFDGGIRNHIPSLKVLERYSKINKVISIYAREKPIKSISDKWQKNVIEMIMRTLDIMSLEISKRDEAMEQMLSTIRQFKIKQFFLPEILDSLYDTNPDHLRELKEAGTEMIELYLGDFLEIK